MYSVTKATQAARFRLFFYCADVSVHAPQGDLVRHAAVESPTGVISFLRGGERWESGVFFLPPRPIHLCYICMFKSVSSVVAPNGIVASSVFSGLYFAVIPPFVPPNPKRVLEVFSDDCGDLRRKMPDERS